MISEKEYLVVRNKEWEAGLAFLLCLLVLLLASSPAASSGDAGTYILTAARVRGTGGSGSGSSVAWDSNMTLLGDASLKNGTISLTYDTLTTGIGAGRALYSCPVRFLDRATRAPASFATTFTFSIRPTTCSSSTSDSAPRLAPFPCFGDGLAFLLTSDPRFLGAADGFLGLFSDAAACPDPATVAVEFDTSLDPLLCNIDDNHVDVDVGVILSAAAAPARDAGVDLKKGVPMTAWVDYSAARKMLRVWLGNSHSRPPRPLIVAPIDLSALLQEFMYVGFSASNGRGAALHLVDNWSFRTFGFSSSSRPALPPPSSPADGNDSRSGSDEISPPPGPSPCLPRLGLVIGGIAGVLFLIATSTTVTLWWRFRWNLDCGDCDCGGEEEVSSTRSRKRSSVNGEPRMEVLTRISLDEIMSATGEFHDSNLLGDGASATVYQGVLAAGSRVAVKRFGRVEHLTSPYAAELPTVIACCRHQNLVPLAGRCCENDELVLVYEFMPNGTLDHALHSLPDHRSAVVLPWGVQKNVVLGVASALAFLHDDCEKRIVHRNVKSCNILLDADFNAKLGYFGLALHNSRGSSGCAALVSQPDGTIGYLAPEYVRSGVATDKSDMYSFGVVALEVATGRRSVDKGLVLVDWVWELWGHRRLLHAADPQLRGRFHEKEMARMLIVGLSCSHLDSNKGRE
ncbi:L-type lectin-domain containing receptor kinase S.6 [Ananas comosus]|uniref:non-specific serine/threonine protein kinase n=1 Tax=Ananas comosus TaxID=4615 RepID=A0A199VAR3_ANACO|nr:L-type lectin-domain containing receptor kinase S.6 [Ananas comosus]